MTSYDRFIRATFDRNLRNCILQIFTELFHNFLAESSVIPQKRAGDRTDKLGDGIGNSGDRIDKLVDGITKLVDGITKLL